MEITKIEEKINRVELGATEVSDQIGGVAYRNLSEMLEFGKMMATTQIGVPKHLRGEVGGCVRIVMQALEWRMSPFAVADKSYVVNDKIAYESQLIHAVVESRAPLQKRLRCVYLGEGVERSCVVTGHIKGETEPLVYHSPKISEIKVQNSPLWKSDPEQQLWYYSVRAWARRYVPDVLLGIYSREELEEAEPFAGPDKAKDITPKSTVGDRLKGPKGRGFSAEHVQTTTAKATEKPVDGQTEVKGTDTPEPGPAPDGKAGDGQEATPASPADPEETIITPDLIAKNLIKSIAGQTDKVRLEEWQNDNNADINALPPELLKGVRKALDDKHIELADQ